MAAEPLGDERWWSGYREVSSTDVPEASLYPSETPRQLLPVRSMPSLGDE
jgi:hypothetical protein